MNKMDAILTFDVGTGSARAALVGLDGRIIDQKSRAHDTYWADHGASEQSPADWWHGIKFSFTELLHSEAGMNVRILGVVGCGQMHAPILLNRNGELLMDLAPIWNDKRGSEFAKMLAEDSLFSESYNPPASAWPGIKLRWISKEFPDVIDRTDVVLMPKDYINFRLSDRARQDPTEAGSSFVYDPVTRNWDDTAISQLGLPRHIFPEIASSYDQIGTITPKASNETGIPVGTPVFAGGGDYPIAVLGSGVCLPGQVSDITGTSSLLSVVTQKPIQSPNLMNAHTPDDQWKAFCVVDAAGDAVRWGRRALNDDDTPYLELTRAIDAVAPGSDGLLFLPYLTGERLGYGQNSRGAYVGLTAGHSSAHLHRAILEGTSLALKSAAKPLIDATGEPDHIIAAAGGARSLPHLQMKASIFGCPFVPVSEVECGLIGCAVLAMKGLGLVSSVAEGAKALVRYQPPIDPQPELQSLYSEQFEVFQSARSSIAKLSESISGLKNLR